MQSSIFMFSYHEFLSLVADWWVRCCATLRTGAIQWFLVYSLHFFILKQIYFGKLGKLQYKNFPMLRNNFCYYVYSQSVAFIHANTVFLWLCDEINILEENTYYQSRWRRGRKLTWTVFTEEIDKVVKTLLLKNCQFQMVLASQYSHLCTGCLCCLNCSKVVFNGMLLYLTMLL